MNAVTSTISAGKVLGVANRAAQMQGGYASQSKDAVGQAYCYTVS